MCGRQIRYVTYTIENEILCIENLEGRIVLATGAKTGRLAEYDKSTIIILREWAIFLFV